MFNRQEVMKRAWRIYRDWYRFGVERGRFHICFGAALKAAWAEMKRSLTIKLKPTVQKLARIEAIKDQIENLKWKSCRYDIGTMEQNLRAELSELEAAL